MSKLILYIHFGCCNRLWALVHWQQFICFGLLGGAGECNLANCITLVFPPVCALQRVCAGPSALVESLVSVWLNSPPIRTVACLVAVALHLGAIRQTTI